MVPDPKWHLRISIAKSLLRLGAGYYLITGAFITSGLLFIAAEVLGILEELI